MCVCVSVCVCVFKERKERRFSLYYFFLAAKCKIFYTFMKNKRTDKSFHISRTHLHTHTHYI